MNSGFAYESNRESWKRFFNSHSHSEAFVATGAQEYVESIRTSYSGFIDIGKIALSASMEVHYAEMELFQAITFPNGLTIIKSNQSEEQKQISFGHELGHQFLLRNTGLWPQTDKPIERFCEYFGLVLIFGDNKERISELFEQYKFSRELIENIHFSEDDYRCMARKDGWVEIQND